MNRINLEEIWLKPAEKFKNIDGSTYWDIGKHSMLEFGEQLLILAAENATVERITTGQSCMPHRYGFIVNKKSILDTIKQIE